MRLIKPSYQILTSRLELNNAIREIEIAARTCYKSEDKIREGTNWDLVRKLIDRGHEAMLEFGSSITVKFICDRGVSHELVRHRIASFAQESTRYCNYSKDKYGGHITFILPKWCKDDLLGEYNSRDEIDPMMGPDDYRLSSEENVYLTQLKYSEDSYLYLIKAGWSPQQARSVLPNSLKTEINIKANIREWRHIFKLRTAKAAHPQMRELMIPLHKELSELIPIVFDGI